MTKKTNNGILIYGRNSNQLIDYGKIAVCCALMAKANIGPINTTLITDEGTLGWLYKSIGRDIVKNAFNSIITRKYSEVTNKVVFHDGFYFQKEDLWNNSDFLDSFELTPYENTLVLDADYLVMDRILKDVWDYPEDVLCNRNLVRINLEKLEDSTSERGLSIPFYHTTALFFRKTGFAKILFDLMKHISENMTFYQYSYRLPQQIHRNDYVFSIAAHILSNFSYEPSIASLPNKEILTAWIYDELYKFNSKNDFTFLCSDTGDKFSLVNLQNISVHILNKFSIGRFADALIGEYRIGKL